MIKWLCSQYLKAKGWNYKDDTGEELGSFVALGAPHTSNWDFITAMTIIYKSKNVSSKFIIKASWMKFPLSIFFKAVGGIGIDREAVAENKDVSSTDTFSKMFHQDKKIAIWISPEGTRSFRDKWKTGFYYIAQKAKVPIVLAYADWKTKTLGLGKVVHLTDDFEADLRKVMDFYSQIHGKIPEKFAADKRFI